MTDGPYKLSPDNGLTSVEKKLIVVLLSCLLVDEEENNKAFQRRAISYARGTTHAFMRAQLPLRLGSLRDTEYKCIFRMSPSAMEALRHVLFPYLQVQLPHSVIKGRSKGNRVPVSVDEKICTGLLFCGGATIGPSIWGNHVCKQTVYNIFYQFIAAIICSKVGEIKFPSTREEMEETTQGFVRQRLCLPIYYGVLGALDGLAIRIWLPSRNECGSQVAFVNRKGFAAMNCQAIADSNCKCIYFNCNSPGGTHDATAWETSNMGVLWRSRAEQSNYVVDARIDPLHDHNRPYYIATDDAYSASLNILCPWAGTGLVTRDPPKDSFNYYFSGGIRNCIERLFGQVYQRWGILWRPLRFSPKRIPHIV